MAPDQEEDIKQQLHIVMFPWLAFGHLIPFLEISKCLAQKGHRISFISTPRNLQRLPKIPPNLSHPHLLNFVSLPLPQVDNLPAQAEATIDLPLDQVPYLKKAYDALEGPLSNFLIQTSCTPDWIIYDFAPHWLPSMASKLGVPCVFLSLFNASFNAFIGHPSEAGILGMKPDQFGVPPDWIPFPSNLAFRKHEILKISSNIGENVSGVTDVFRVVNAVQGCDFVAIRSSMEFESEWFNLLEKKLFQKPVLPVGLLPPPPSVLQGHDQEQYIKNEEWVMRISEWLDKQGKGSVVYVALGTEATLSREELAELALGLELSELAFFWVLRRPAGSTTEDPTDLLPVGFQDRTRGRGFMCMGWAPQTKILGHPSVGCFLTHCGWGSTIEGLVSGCPLVLLPLINDQALIARLLVWKKMGLEIERDEEDGSFTRESVAKSLRTVMVDAEGAETYRAKARELREVFGDKVRNDRYLDDFVSYLKERKRVLGSTGRSTGSTI
ncbi:UDP-glucuronosyl/UDP-glucosyltransferase [Macleaya cordata]|uniref:Glycosyltransferase n=1 Tax=Macleaya cordata TaxID=56857 RepID=A0A200PNG7_MACCD|nr:UDP-glucuronosyl/UDP-glucosyltransferase [Macleaya cordata]